MSCFVLFFVLFFVVIFSFIFIYFFFFFLGGGAAIFYVWFRMYLCTPCNCVRVQSVYASEHFDFGQYVSGKCVTDYYIPSHTAPSRYALKYDTQPIYLSKFDAK